MTFRYENVLDGLRDAYDGAAGDRDQQAKQPWKLAERDAFLRRLRDEDCGRLLELGAGTGQDSAFFARQGLTVVATDLSPEMVARCRDKGIDAHVMDFLHLNFPPESFDAVYALNCLLHVPNADLPAVLAAVAALLRPGGLFFLGVYGGTEASEGLADGDTHVPPRFFSFRTDGQMREFAARSFAIVDFHVTGEGHDRFQSLTLRRPA